MRASVAALAALTATALLVSCSDDSDPGASGGTVPTTARPTTTTDPYAVPAVIDVAYVNKVLGALDAAVGDITRMVVTTRSLPPEAHERLSEIYVPDLAQLKVSGYQRDIDSGLHSYRPSPGNRETTVTDLISALPNCIFAQVHRDYSQVAVAPGDPRLSTLWVTLKGPVPYSQFNTTGWIYGYDGAQQDYVRPENQCVGS